MSGHGSGAIALIIQPATADQLAPVVMRAYGLTERERMISRLVLHGRSTRAISDEHEISMYTVQDHMKSIFEKTGVRSRRELVATVLREQYLPHAQAGREPGATGYYTGSSVDQPAGSR